jgi:hypothetical protein
MGKRTIYGLPRKNISRLKGGDTNYIDTTVLYKAAIAYLSNHSPSKQYSHYNRYSYYEREDYNSYPYISYFKFYGNGKLGLFFILKKDTANLTRDDFNPLKAEMGYYTVNGNIVKTRISTIGAYCTLHISNEKGYIKDDTLSLENKNHHETIYLKKIVPNELLENWSPDW